MSVYVTPVTDFDLEDGALPSQVKFFHSNPTLLKTVKFLTFSSVRITDKVRGGMIYYMVNDNQRVVEIHSNVAGRTLINQGPVAFPLSGPHVMKGRFLTDQDYMLMFGLTKTALLKVIENYAPKAV